MQDAQFFKELDDFMEEVNKECAAFEVEIVGEMLSDICDVNALLTGRCTASWTASSGSPRYRDARDINDFNKIDRATAKERSMSTLINIRNHKLGETLYLSNGTDYVSGIEEGVNSRKSIKFVELTSVKYSHIVQSSVHVP